VAAVAGAGNGWSVSPPKTQIGAGVKFVCHRNDAELVVESLSGNRDAFGQIVARYQSLVCSLAYSATGSLSQSEDLAQETFVAAWKQLADLREPENCVRGFAASRGISSTTPCVGKGVNRAMLPKRWKPKFPNRHSPNRSPTNRPSATKRRRFSGARSNASRKFTANRSFCFIANINPSKPSRKIWS
jgi:hypothetical protein